MSRNKKLRNKETRPGRNDSCLCGSGLKLKNCCNNSYSSFIKQFGHPKTTSDLEALAKVLRETKKTNSCLTRDNSKAIISAVHNGHRFIAVHDKLYYTKSDKTFHDFLTFYLRKCFGETWFKQESKKSLNESHTVFKWLNGLIKNKLPGKVGSQKVRLIQANGQIAAFIHLAYDLYTLDHHNSLLKKLVKRLKNPDLFQGALYETFVIATFIRAGFDIEFEDENDGSTTHCEFTATYKQDGARFSVEAKSCHRRGILGFPGERIQQENIKLNFDRQLIKALNKQAQYSRIIFIDINVPITNPKHTLKSPWFDEIGKILNELESSSNPCLPSSYLFITNHPYHWAKPNQQAPGKQFVATGFNIQDFKSPQEDLYKHLHFINKHRHFIALKDSLDKYNSVPTYYI